jgi:iron(III) transport system permease protein
MRPRRLDRSAAAQWLIVVVTAILVLAPALPILLQVFVQGPLYAGDWQYTLGNITKLFSNPALGGVAVTTIIFAVVATAVAQVVGVLAALVLGRTDVPARGLMGAMMMWPLYLSHLIFAVGWLILYGPSGYLTQLVSQMAGGQPWNLYSLLGMALVAGAAQAPLAYLYCLYGVVRSIDPALESAARTAGAGPFSVMARVTLPLMLPSIITSTALNIVVMVEMLSIPLFIGRQARLETLSTFLYTEGVATSSPQHGVVAASALILVVLVSATLGLQRLLLRDAHRFETIKGKGSRLLTLSLGQWRWPVFAILSVYLLLTVIAPVAGIVLRAFTSYLTPFVAPWNVLTLANFERLFGSAAFVRSIFNTAWIALASSAIGTLLAALIALVVQRSSFGFRSGLEALAYSPRIVPGLIAGLGMFYAAIVFPPFGWLRGSVWIIVAAYVMATIPLALGVIQPAVVQISADLDKAARTVGADWLTGVWRVLLPLMKPALLGSFVLLFIVHLKSYVIAIFLMAPGLEVMGVTMLSLWNNGDVGVTAAFATLQIIMIALFLLLARIFFKVKLYE